MDENNPTCDKRFAKQGIPQTEEARRAYRELIITTPRLGECISGTILYDETVRQRKKEGTLFIKAIIDAGINPGIRIDTGGTRSKQPDCGPRDCAELGGRLTLRSGVSARGTRFRLRQLRRYFQKTILQRGMDAIGVNRIGKIDALKYPFGADSR